jgi:hypothetical protein
LAKSFGGHWKDTSEREIIMKRRTLTEKEFAAVCGLSYGYIKTLRRRGLISCLRVGRRVLYLPEHITLFLKGYEQF